MFSSAAGDPWPRAGNALDVLIEGAAPQILDPKLRGAGATTGFFTEARFRARVAASSRRAASCTSMTAAGERLHSRRQIDHLFRSRACEPNLQIVGI